MSLWGRCSWWRGRLGWVLSQERPLPNRERGGLAVWCCCCYGNQTSCGVAVIIFRCNLCRFLFWIAPFRLTSNSNTNKTNREEPKDRDTLMEAKVADAFWLWNMHSTMVLVGGQLMGPSFIPFISLWSTLMYFLLHLWGRPLPSNCDAGRAQIPAITCHAPNEYEDMTRSLMMWQEQEIGAWRN